MRAWIWVYIHDDRVDIRRLWRLRMSCCKKDKTLKNPNWRTSKDILGSSCGDFLRIDQIESALSLKRHVAWYIHLIPVPSPICPVLSLNSFRDLDYMLQLSRSCLQFELCQRFKKHNCPPRREKCWGWGFWSHILASSRGEAWTFHVFSSFHHR